MLRRPISLLFASYIRRILVGCRQSVTPSAAFIKTFHWFPDWLLTTQRNALRHIAVCCGTPKNVTLLASRPIASQRRKASRLISHAAPAAASFIQSLAVEIRSALLCCWCSLIIGRHPGNQSIVGRFVHWSRGGPESECHEWCFTA